MNLPKLAGTLIGLYLMSLYIPIAKALPLIVLLGCFAWWVDERSVCGGLIIFALLILFGVV